jgi:hypothetical protein
MGQPFGMGGSTPQPGEPKPLPKPGTGGGGGGNCSLPLGGPVLSIKITWGS